jgi:uncharacterized protein (DUF488 family)
MNLYTIGFTQKSAQTFFTLLKQNRVNILIDIRLNNKSQLAGFTKQVDLAYFLRELCAIDYLHVPEFAPTSEILSDYKNKTINWIEYEIQFNRLMSDRKAETMLNVQILDNACFLCSEHQAEQCHRRLVVEYLASNLNQEFNIKHLK